MTLAGLAVLFCSIAPSLNLNNAGGVTRGVNADKDYVLSLNWNTINNATSPAGELWGKSVQSNPLTLKTENGNAITFSSSNSFMEYANVSHGSVIGNGAQLSADFYNTTAITGIKKIEIIVWWDWTSPTTWDGQKTVNITTAQDSSFIVEKDVYTFNKEAESTVTSTETYTLDCSAFLPSYFKIDCGIQFGFKYFKRIDITYSCTPAPSRATVLMDAPWAKSLGKFSGKMGTFNLTGSDGDTIGMSASDWVEYAPDGWGCFCTNGQHWDAEFHNTTPINSIKRVSFRIWWNIYNAASVSGPQIINITTATNADFTEGVTKTTFTKTGEITAVGVHDTFELRCTNNASYVKLDFGDSASNAGFHGIESFIVTYLA